MATHLVMHVSFNGPAQEGMIVMGYRLPYYALTMSRCYQVCRLPGSDCTQV